MSKCIQLLRINTKKCIDGKTYFMNTNRQLSWQHKSGIRSQNASDFFKLLVRMKEWIHVLTKYNGARLKQSLELIGSVSKHCATAVLPEIGFCLKKVPPRIRKKKKKAGPLSASQFRLLGRLELIQTTTEPTCCRSRSENVRNVISLVNFAAKVFFHFRDIFWSILQHIIRSEGRVA